MRLITRTPYWFRFLLLSTLILVVLTLKITSTEAATITVTGACTLAEAITAANTDAATANCPAGSGADTIVLTANLTLTTVNNTTNGANGLPSITSQITIRGNGFTILRSTAVGTPNFRLFHIAAAGNLTLDRVTVQNGLSSTSQGGGIYNLGTLTLTRSIVDDSTAVAANTGGNDTSQGGGIYNDGSLTMSYSTIRDSLIAVGNGGGTDTPQGGGLFNSAAGTANISNSLFFNNNTSSNGSAGADNADGGGIYNAGSLTLTNSEFDDNDANADSNDNGDAARGGAIFNTGILNVTGTTFDDSDLNVGGNGTADLGQGGVIYNSGTASFTNVSFSDTDVNAVGGGNNDAALGGAIYNITGSTTLVNVSFDNNDVDSNAPGNNGDIARGGAIYVQSGTVTVTHATFNGNDVDGDTQEGEAIYNNAGATVIFRNSISTDTCLGGGTYTLQGVNRALAGSCGGTPISGMAGAADNGGNTISFALDATSNALDAAASAFCPTTDQRGLPRGFNGTGAVNAPQTGDCDIGAYEYVGGMITGFVWEDINLNGTQDLPTEPPISGATVNLNGTVVATTTTNSNGRYFFTGLATGAGNTYSVTVTAPSGYTFTSQNIGGNENIDSDVATATGTTGNFNLSAANPIRTNLSDAGLFRRVSLSGFVYVDQNNNGLNESEPGVVGVNITLTGTDILGAVVNTSTPTLADGSYTFSNLNPGNYTITQSAPTGCYTDGIDSLGTLGGNRSVNDTFSSILAGSGDTGTGYNFGELNASPTNLNLAVTSNPVDEGSSTTLNGSFTGDACDAHTVTIDWGNGDPVQTVNLAAGVTTFSVAKVYSDDNPTATTSDGYTIQVTVSDGLSIPLTGTTPITVNNVAPTLSNVAITSPVDENGTVTLTGDITDPSTLDTFVLSIDWDGAGAGAAELVNLTAGSTTFSVTHTYLDDDPTATPSDGYTVDVLLTDDDTGSDTETVNVTVNNVAPTLSNVAVTTPINENGTVTLTGDITDPGTLDTFVLSIDWNDGSPLQTVNLAAGSTTFNVTHTYLDDDPTATASDIYAVGVTLTDDDTGSDTQTVNATVNNVAPSLSNVAITTPINENGTVTLTGDLTDPGTLDTFVLSIDWNDGSPLQTVNLAAGSTTFSVTHTYLDDDPTATPSDTYGVAVTLTDDDTGSDTQTVNVTVNNVAPTLSNVAVTSPVNENGTVTLTGDLTDPGTLDTFVLSIDWNDGSPLQTVNLAAGSTTFSVTHTYLDDNPTGTASDNAAVVVTLTDDDTGSDTQTVNVTVNNVAPTLSNVAVTSPANEGDTVTLTGDITDPGTLDTFVLSIDWNDGSPLQTVNLAAGSTTFNVTHTYLDDNPTGTASDIYGVAITLTDDDTGSDTETVNVTVNNVAPTLSNVAVTNPVNENGTATLTGDITDPGTLDTFVLSIDWNDGSPLQTLNLAAGSTTFSVTHTYLDDDPTGTASDIYAVGITLTDDDTGSDTETLNATVNNVAPTLSNVTITTPINENGSVTLTGDITDPGTLDTFVLSIDWDGAGVGAAQLVNLPIGTTSFSIIHTYLDDDPTSTPSDIQGVVVTLTDDDTGSDTETVNVTVNNIAPTLSNVAITSPANEGDTFTLTGDITDPGTLDTFVLSIDWGGTAQLVSLPAGTTTFSETFTYLDDNPTATPSDTVGVVVTLTDDDTGSDTETVNVTVNNVAPTLSNVAVTSPVNENGTATLTGDITDPGTLDTFVLSIDWDGAGAGAAQLVNLPAGTTSFSIIHTYLDDDPTATVSDNYTIDVLLTDDDTDSDTATTNVIVNNVAPILNNVTITTPINEGDTATLMGDIVDPGTLDTFTLTVDWNDGSPLQTVNLPAGTTNFSLTHGYPDDHPATGTPSDTFTIAVTLTDDDTEADNVTVPLTVNNAAPILTVVGNQVADTNVPLVLTNLGTFTDAGSGANETFTYSINWDDGSPNDTGTATIDTNTTSITGSFDGTHSYTNTGTFTVTVTITDDDGESDIATFDVVVTTSLPTLSNLVVNNVNENGTATLTGDVDDGGSGDDLTLDIDWGDGSPVQTLLLPGGTTNFNVTHVYLDDNPTATPSDAVVINLTITDETADSSTATANLTVSNVAPILSNVAITSPVNENGTATLTGDITDPGTLDTFVLSIDWDGAGAGVAQLVNLPAGTTSFSIIHTYLDDDPTATATDSYTVDVLLTDDDTGSDTDTVNVTVNNVAPTLSNVAMSTPVNEGGTATLTGNITDPGTLDTFVLSIDWGDGSPVQNVNLAAGSTTFNVTHVYRDDHPAVLTASDSFTVNVAISDDDSGTDSDTAALVVNNVAPTLTVVGNQTIALNTPLTLVNLGTFTDPASGANETFTYTINWGDATPDDTGTATIDTNTTSITGSFDGSHTYTSLNTFTVTVTLEDNDSGSSVQIFQVTVTNTLPTLSNLAATNVNENGTTTLTGDVDDAGSGDNLTLDIDWGDGSPVQTLLLPGGTTNFNVTHVYLDDNPTATASDTWPINLTITDETPDSSNASILVTVNNVAPTLSNVAISTPINEGGTATLTGNITDPGTQDTFTLNIDWGDGSPVQNVNLAAGSTTFSVTHVYPDDHPTTGTASDVLNVSVTITDDDTGSDSDAAALTVNNVAPVLTVPASQGLPVGGTITLTNIGTFTDAGSGANETFTYSINWDDGSPNDTGTATIDTNTTSITGSFDGSHTYAGTGPFNVSVTVTDDDGGTHTQTFVVAAGNTAPTTTGLTNITALEDAANVLVNLFAAFADAQDPDASLTYTITNNTNPTLVTSAGFNNTTGELTLDFLPNQNGSATLTIRATDSLGLFVETPLQVDVTPVNDVPSFTHQGNRTHLVGTNTPQTVAAWVSAIDLGPADEDATQSVANYLVNVVTAPVGFFTTAPTISNTGTLSYTPSGIIGTATIQVQLQDDGGGTDTSAPQTFTITLQPAPVDIAVDKIANVTSAEVGQVITYTITVTNNSAVNATGLTVTDLLPTSLQLNTSTPSAGTYNSNNGVWTIGNLAPGTVTLTLVAQVKAGAEGTDIVNNASVTALNETDSNNLNNADSISVHISAPLLVTKQGYDLSPATPLRPGDTVGWIVCAQNQDSIAVTNVTLTDTLDTTRQTIPTTLRFGVAAVCPTTTPVNGLTSQANAPTNANLSVTIASVPAGQVGILYFETTMKDPGTSSLPPFSHVALMGSLVLSWLGLNHPRRRLVFLLLVLVLLGQLLWLPAAQAQEGDGTTPQPIIEPTPVDLPFVDPTPTPFPTEIPPTETPIPTATETPVPTATLLPTDIPTATPTETLLPTDIPSSTPIPTLTAATRYETHDTVFQKIGAWTSVESLAASGETYLLSQDSAAALTLDFVGDSFTLWYFTGADYGIFQIFLDEQFLLEINTFNMETTLASPLEIPVTAGQHHLRIQAVSLPIALDAIDIQGQVVTPATLIPSPTFTATPIEATVEVPTATTTVEATAAPAWTRYESNDPFVQLQGNWTQVDSSTVSGGSYLYSEQVDSSLVFDFVGEKLRISYLVFETFGLFDIYLDDQWVGSVDGYSSASDLKFTDEFVVPYGQHRLKIQNSGQKHPDSQGMVIALDAIDILGTAFAPSPTPIIETPSPTATLEQPTATPTSSSPVSGGWTRYEMDHSALKWQGAWQQQPSSYVSGGSYVYSLETQASVELTFTGEAVRLNYLKFWNFGIFDIYLDETLVATIDGYHAASAGAATEDFWMTPGSHTLRIQNTGQNGPDAQGVVIALDSIDVKQGTLATETPHPSVSINGRVFDDANGNRQWDESEESGIGNAAVSLYADNGDAVFNIESETLVATVQVPADGTYDFEAATNGIYWLWLDETTLPEHYMDTVVTGEHGIQNPARVEIDEASPAEITFAYTLDTDGDTSPDAVEGTGDQDHDSIPNHLDPFDPSGTVYIGATGNAVSGVQIRLVYGAGILADTIQPNPQTTGADGAYRFDITSGTANGVPTTGTRDFRLEIVSLPAGYTFPSTTPAYQPSATTFDASPTANSGQIVAFSHPPNPNQSHLFYMAFTIQAGDSAVVNNHIAVDAAPAPVNAFLVSNTACASHAGNSQTSCGTANLTLNSALGMSLTPNNAVSEAPGQTINHLHTLTNTGQQTDRYEIKFLGGNRGWTQQLQIVSGTTTLATLNVGQSFALTTANQLAPNASLTLRHLITIPTGTANGVLDTSLIQVNSLTDPTLSRTVTDTTTATTGCLTGILFHDVNKNGTREASEPVFANVRMNILSGATNVGQVTTDANGVYNLGGLPAGNYTVQIDTASLPGGTPIYFTPNTPSQTVNVTVGGTCVNGNFDLVLVDPAITKGGSVSQARPGESVTFTVTLTNPSTTAISNVTVVDPLNSLYIFSSATTSQGTFAFNTAANTVTYTIGTVAPGASITMTLTVTMSSQATANTSITNTATVNFAQGPAKTSPAVTVTVLGTTTPTPTTTSTTTTTTATQVASASTTSTTTSSSTQSTGTSSGGGSTSTLPNTLPALGVRPMPFMNANLWGTWVLRLSLWKLLLTVAAFIIAVGGLTWSIVQWLAENRSDKLAKLLPKRPTRRMLLVVPTLAVMSGMLGVVLLSTSLYKQPQPPVPIMQAPPVMSEVSTALPIVWTEETVNETTPLQPGFQFAMPEIPAEQLQIPRLGIATSLVNAPIVDANWDISQLKDEVAHLEGTAHPGTMGNAVLAGHIQHEQGVGPFRNLEQLEAGDLILASGEGVEYAYIVTEVMEVTPDAVEVTYPSNQPLLTLITCAKWDDATWTYTSRTVVRARFSYWRIADETPKPVSKWVRYEIGDEQVQLKGNWTKVDSDYTSNGDYLYSQDEQASVILRFTGEKVRLHYLYFWDFGIFDVYIDDRKVATIDGYNTQSMVASSEIFFVEPGTHTLRIENSGRKNPTAQGMTLSLDAIDIYSTRE